MTRTLMEVLLPGALPIARGEYVVIEPGTHQLPPAGLAVPWGAELIGCSRESSVITAPNGGGITLAMNSRLSDVTLAGLVPVMVQQEPGAGAYVAQVNMSRVYANESPLTIHRAYSCGVKSCVFNSVLVDGQSTTVSFEDTEFVAVADVAGVAIAFNRCCWENHGTQATYIHLRQDAINVAFRDCYVERGLASPDNPPIFMTHGRVGPVVIDNLYLTQPGGNGPLRLMASDPATVNGVRGLAVSNLFGYATPAPDDIVMHAGEELVLQNCRLQAPTGAWRDPSVLRT